MTETEETVLDLLPCPFCGCARIYERGFRCFECPECRAEGPTKATKAEAVAAWNTRAALSRAPEAASEDAYRRAILWAIDRTDHEFAPTAKEQANTVAGLIGTLRGEPSPASSYAPDPWTTSGKLEIAHSPPESKAIKTVGWAALAENGNNRLWSKDRATVQQFAVKHGCEVVRLVSPSPEMGEISREEIARTICDVEWCGSQPWDRKPQSFRNRYLDYADAILTKLKENGLSREGLGGLARSQPGRDAQERSPVPPLSDGSCAFGDEGCLCWHSEDSYRSGCMHWNANQPSEGDI